MAWSGGGDRSSPWRRQAGGGCSWECGGGGGGGPVAGEVGVVGAEGAGAGKACSQRGRAEATPAVEATRVSRRQGGSQQQESGEGVDGTLDEQDRVEIVRGCGQPEATAGLAGAGGHALEGAPSAAGRVPKSSAPTGFWWRLQIPVDSEHHSGLF